LKDKWEANYKPRAKEVEEGRRNGSAVGKGKADVRGVFSVHILILIFLVRGLQMHGEPLKNLSPSDDALKNWLGIPPTPGVNDPIAYWHGYLKSGHPLARMALDFLTVPSELA
jgi:hypothetical protein